VNSGPTNTQFASQPIAVLIGRLWRSCSAERYGISYVEFEQLLLEIGFTYHWGAACGQEPAIDQQTAFLSSLKVEDLVLARACASGNDSAWERFLIEYREMLYRAAYGITKQDARGRELADSFYAQLFGTSARDGVRQSKLASYTGRGSLAGWLRSVLAQRFVDEYRQSRRTMSLEDQEVELVAALPDASAAIDSLSLNVISKSIGKVLAGLESEDRFLLHAYYLDQRNLAQIAKLLGVHESTISRKLHRLTKKLRTQLLKELQSSGLSRAAAEEALSADVRDLEVNVRKFLQATGETPFQEVKATAGENN
jgi:RNA polymerase sigma-70 factor, ECF subfamily